MDIKVIEDSDEFEGEIESWQEILIHDDPDELRTFSNILIKIVDLNQDDRSDLPIGAREHIHVDLGFDLGENSSHVIVGRIDAKGTGELYSDFIPKDSETKTGL